MLTSGEFGKRLKMVAAVLGIAALAVLAPELRAQASVPIPLEELQQDLEASEGAPTTDDIISKIWKNGVAFRMDGDAKTAILISGAKGKRSADEVLAIIREAEDNCATCPPLSKMDILGLVFSGLPPARIGRMVRWRRLSFECTPTEMLDLKNTGVSDELLETIGQACPTPPVPLDKPLSKQEVLELLASRAPEEQILELVEVRNVGDLASDPANLMQLKKAGATNSLIGRIAGVDLPEGYVLARAVRGRDYNERIPHGRLDLLAEVDQETVFRFQRNLFSYKLLRGKPPRNPRVRFTQPLPRLPASEWEIRDTREKGRSKNVQVTVLDSPPGGHAGLQISINDDKGGADLYHIQVEWALKPFSPEGMRRVVRETKGGSWQDLIREVQFRGVSFDLDSSLENSFRRDGAPSELLRAVRSAKREDNF